MSGGNFHYLQHNIDDASVEIEQKIKDYSKTCDEETLARLKIAADTLFLAGQMLHIVDRFISGDIGDETFAARWTQEIGQCLKPHA
jgi:hypothetical protein